jgi:hypothetical protein
MSETEANNTTKWVVGIVVSLLVGGAGLVALLEWIDKQTSCNVSGTVYDYAGGQAIYGAEIVYRDSAGGFEVLAESGRDGTFSTDCSGIGVSDFPLHLFVRNGISGCPYITNTEIVRGQETTNMNLSVALILIRKSADDPLCIIK